MIRFFCSLHSARRLIVDSIVVVCQRLSLKPFVPTDRQCIVRLVAMLQTAFDAKLWLTVDVAVDKQLSVVSPRE
jgi:hypothetical protein